MDMIAGNKGGKNMGKKRDRRETDEQTDIAIERGAGEPEVEGNDVPQGDIHPTVDPPEEDTIEEQAQKIEAEAGMIRIQINTAVNGHMKGDRLVVDQEHPFYRALLSQNLAEVID